MAVTHYTITANFADLLGVAYPTTGSSRAPVVAWLETNVGSTEGVVDSLNDLILLGPSRQTADSSGQVVWADVVGSDSDAEDINLADGTLQYRVTAEYVNASTRRRGERWSSGWFSLTADVNLADVVAEQYAPASWQTAFMEQAQDLLDQQEAISGLTGEDDAVALLINTPSSDTIGALSDVYGEVEDTVDNLTATTGLSPGQRGFATDTAEPYRYSAGTTLWTRYADKVNALAIPGIDPDDPANWVDKVHAIAKARQQQYGGCDIYLPNDVQWKTKPLTDTDGEWPLTVTWPRPALAIRKGVSYHGDRTEMLWDSSSLHASFIGTRPAVRVPWPAWSTDANASPKAIITGDISLGQSNFVVNSSAAFAVGDDVVLRLGQISNDTNEPLSVQWGTVTAIPDSTHITLDVQADRALTIADQTTNPVPAGSGAYSYLSSGSGGIDNPGAHSIYLVDEIADGHAEGFVLKSPVPAGSLYSSQGATAFYNRGATFANIRSHNGGPIAAYYSQDVTFNDWVCTRADIVGGNAALGRVANFGSGSKNIVINRLSGKMFEGVAVLAEASSQGVVRNLLLENTHPSRLNSTVPVLQAQGGSKLVIEDFELGGSGGTALRPNDSTGGALENIVIRGNAKIRTNTSLQLMQPRDFKQGVTLSNGNQYDAPGEQRYGAPVRWRRKIKLTAGAGPVIKLPDGLIAKGSVYASSLTGISTVTLANGVMNYNLLPTMQAATTTVLPNHVTGLGATTSIWWGSRRFNRTLTVTTTTPAAGAYLILEVWYMPPLDDENVTDNTAVTATTDPDVDLALVQAYELQAITSRAVGASGLTNSTTETAIATFNLPKAVVFPGVSMTMRLGGYNDYAAGSGVLRYKLRLGSVSGTSVLQFDVPTQASATTIQSWMLNAEVTLRGVSSASTSFQLTGVPSFSAGGVMLTLPPISPNVSTVDTTADTAFVWTAQWLTLASTSNVMRCDVATARINGYPLERA